MCACEPESYPSDLTDAQWELIAPMVVPRPGGRPATHPRRRIVDAILYLNRTGCSWRQLPHDFPPWETVYWYFRWVTTSVSTHRIHDALRAAVRDAAGRDPMASAGIVDAQSVKGADTVGAHSRGYDAGKKVNGRKRHIVVDTLGLLVVVLVTAASLQDRDGGRRILDRARMAMPSIALVWADGGYAGKLVTWVARYCRIVVRVCASPRGMILQVSAAGRVADEAVLVVAGAPTATNTPETTRSGLLGGMPVAVATGRCLAVMRKDAGLIRRSKTSTS